MTTDGIPRQMTDQQKILALRAALTEARGKIATLPDRERVTRVLAATD